MARASDLPARVVTLKMPYFDSRVWARSRSVTPAGTIPRSSMRSSTSLAVSGRTPPSIFSPGVAPRYAISRSAAAFMTLLKLSGPMIWARFVQM